MQVPKNFEAWSYAGETTYLYAMHFQSGVENTKASTEMQMMLQTAEQSKQVSEPGCSQPVVSGSWAKSSLPRPLPPTPNDDVLSRGRLLARRWDARSRSEAVAERLLRLNTREEMLAFLTTDFRSPLLTSHASPQTEACEVICDYLDLSDSRDDVPASAEVGGTNDIYDEVDLLAIASAPVQPAGIADRAAHHCTLPTSVATAFTVDDGMAEHAARAYNTPGFRSAAVPFGILCSPEKLRDSTCCSMQGFHGQKHAQVPNLEMLPARRLTGEVQVVEVDQTPALNDETNMRQSSTQWAELALSAKDIEKDCQRLAVETDAVRPARLSDDRQVLSILCAPSLAPADPLPLPLSLPPAAEFEERKCKAAGHPSTAVVADFEDDAGPERAEARRLTLERLALERQVAAEVEKARARALHTVPVHNQAGNLVDDRANSLASQQASIHSLEARTCDRRSPGCICKCALRTRLGRHEMTMTRRWLTWHGSCCSAVAQMIKSCDTSPWQTITSRLRRSSSRKSLQSSNAKYCSIYLFTSAALVILKFSSPVYELMRIPMQVAALRERLGIVSAGT